jgi:hypothetical protein
MRSCQEVVVRGLDAVKGRQSSLLAIKGLNMPQKKEQHGIDSHRPPGKRPWTEIG